MLSDTGRTEPLNRKTMKTLSRQMPSSFKGAFQKTHVDKLVVQTKDQGLWKLGTWL